MAMIKHMAAAVLYAMVALLGPGDAAASGAVAEPDADDERSAKCVSYMPERGCRDDSLILSAASRLCGEQIDSAWVVTHDERPAAAVAVHQTQDHVALVDIMARPGGTGGAPDANATSSESAQLNSTLLAVALDRCRENDALKVIVHAQGMELDVIREVVEPRGYQFSRGRTEGGAAEVEFYTDLYWSDDATLRS
jgi:hypothetical protein